MIQCIELPVVAGIAALAIFTERLPQTSLEAVLPLLCLPLILRFLVAGRIVETTTILWPLLSLVALCALTIYVTPAWHYTWPELVRFLAGVALCLAVINWFHPVGTRYFPDARRPAHIPWRFRIGVIVFALTAVTLTTVGLLALAPTSKFLPAAALFDHPLVHRITTTGTFNPNRVAGVAVLAVPLFFALFMGTLGKEPRSILGWLNWGLIKVGSVGLFGYLSVALVITQSRGALLALGCAVVVVLLLLGRRGIIVLAAMALISIVVLSQLQTIDLNTLLVRDEESAQHTTLLLQDRNLQGRLLLWQRALHGLADAPLTGMGLGAFEAISQEPYPPLPAFVPDPDMSHVHNIFLQVALDFGLPGLIAFVALLVLVGVRLVQMTRRAAPQSELRTWGIGLIGTFVAYLIYNTFDALTLGARPAFAVWLLFGLWIGTSEWSQQRIAQNAKRHRSAQSRSTHPRSAHARRTHSRSAEQLYPNDDTLSAPNVVPVVTAGPVLDHTERLVRKATAPSPTRSYQLTADDQRIDDNELTTDKQAKRARSEQAMDDWEARSWAITSGTQE